jgi:hypothetical protein
VKLTPSKCARAINDLLIDHGYPPDRLDGWWSNDVFAYKAGMSPSEGFIRGQHAEVYRRLRKQYKQSAKAVRRLLADPERMADLRARAAEWNWRRGA